MKKIFTLFVAAFAAATSFAQVVMVDPAGKEYANGETMIITGSNEEGEVFFASPSVKNKGTQSVSVKLSLDIKSLPANTSLQQCFAGSCFMHDELGVVETGSVTVAAGGTKTTATEWQCYDYIADNYAEGECVVEFTIYADNVAGDKVTVKYVNGTSHLTSANTEVTVVATYSLTGTVVTANQKGIVLQQMSDGTVRKVIVK